MIRIVAPLLVALALAGCASDSRYDTYTALPKLLFGQLKTRITGGPERPEGYGIDPRALAETEFAILGAGYGDVKAGLLLEEFSADSEIYRSPDGVEIAITNMVARRITGLGADLRAVYLSPEDPAYRGFRRTEAEGREYWRHIELLLEGVPTRLTMLCRLEKGAPDRVELILESYDTIRYAELCRDSKLYPNRVFENMYWVGETGQVWRSRQWIGPQAEFPIILEALNPAEASVEDNPEARQ